VDKDDSKVIELRESLLIGILLSVNNMGMGIGAGIHYTGNLCGSKLSFYQSRLYLRQAHNICKTFKNPGDYFGGAGIIIRYFGILQ